MGARVDVCRVGGGGGAGGIERVASSYDKGVDGSGGDEEEGVLRLGVAACDMGDAVWRMGSIFGFLGSMIGSGSSSKVSGSEAGALRLDGVVDGFERSSIDMGILSCLVGWVF